MGSKERTMQCTCSVCKTEFHIEKAKYCSRCGTKLDLTKAIRKTGRYLH